MDDLGYTGPTSNDTVAVQDPPSVGVPTQNPDASSASHPAVERAGWLHKAAEALAGGPRYTEAIDPLSGATVRSKVPLTKGDIGMAIVLEALTGAMSGLAQTGPGATGRAAAAGAQTVMQQQQQSRQQQDERAQQEYQNQAAAIVRKASLAEVNSRTLLNVANASRLHDEAIKDLIGINRASGVLDLDPSLLENDGQPMTESDLRDAVQKGAISPTSHIGPVAGYTIVKGPDGTPHAETMHLVIRDENQKVELTPEDWKRYAGLPGFPATSTMTNTMQIPLRMKQKFNEQLGTRTLANHRLEQLRTVLDGTPYAVRVPKGVDFSQPDLDKAWTAFSRYTSHDAENSDNPLAALKAMSAAKRNPDGSLTPNPDARYADTLAASMGGWPLLQAAADEIVAHRKSAQEFAVIDSDAKAQAVLASPKRFSPDQVKAAQGFLSISREQGVRKAATEARARALSDGTAQQAMYRYGKNPVTGEVLSLQNAPPSALVDPEGNVVPQDLIGVYKPTAQQKQMADSARIVQGLVGDIRSAVTKNPRLIGPLAGRSREGLAAAGLGSGGAQKLLDNVNLLQTALTRMHMGSRGSELMLKKSEDLIKASQNPQQMMGALEAIGDIATRYAQQDQLTTVSQFKARQGAGEANGQSQSLSDIQVNPQTGQEVGWDGEHWIDVHTGKPVQ